MAETPPVVGAALPVHWIAPYRDWLFEKDRDLELQGFHEAAVLEGDWQGLAAQAKKELDGFRGRLGLHGPFWGFTVASEDPAVREIVTRRLMQGLDACAAVGAVQMVIHSPYTTWDHNNLDNRPGSRDAVIGHARATLAPVLTRAEDQGVQLVMENIADVDPAERRRLVEGAGLAGPGALHRHGPCALRALLHRGTAGGLFREVRGRAAGAYASAGRGRLCGPALGDRRGHDPLGGRVPRARGAGDQAASGARAS